MTWPEHGLIEVFPSSLAFDAQTQIKTYGIRVIGDREALLDLVARMGGKAYSTIGQDGIEYVVTVQRHLDVCAGQRLRCGAAQCSVISVCEYSIPYP